MAEHEFCVQKAATPPLPLIRVCEGVRTSVFVCVLCVTVAGGSRQWFDVHVCVCVCVGMYFRGDVSLHARLATKTIRVRIITPH